MNITTNVDFQYCINFNHTKLTATEHTELVLTNITIPN